MPEWDADNADVVRIVRIDPRKPGETEGLWGAMIDDELSAGVIAFLQKGHADSPRADAEACKTVATERPPSDLVAEVRALVDEALAIPLVWDGMSLGDAGRHVAAHMGEQHPELSQRALDSLAWNFTYDWR